jgi:hypothetical protein
MKNIEYLIFVQVLLGIWWSRAWCSGSVGSVRWCCWSDRRFYRFVLVQQYLNLSHDESKEGGVLVEVKLNEQDPKISGCDHTVEHCSRAWGRPTLVMCLHIRNLFNLSNICFKKCWTSSWLSCEAVYHCNSVLMLNLVYLCLMESFVSGIHSTWRKCGVWAPQHRWAEQISRWFGYIQQLAQPSG